MHQATITSISILLCSLMTAPTAQADWGDVWDNVTGYVEQETEEARQQLKDINEKWGINESLQRLFGKDVDERSALVGTFYDLKRPIEGSSAKAANRHTAASVIREFIQKDWDESVLSQYYSPRVRLYSPHFYLPLCKAEYAPYAFQSDDKGVQPTCWVVVYRGVVKAPKTGRFRFAAVADDTLMVRFNNETVLEHGWYRPTTDNEAVGHKQETWQQLITRPEDPAALYRYKEAPFWTKANGGMGTGKTFDVVEGEYYPIEILITEIPGGVFGFALMVEDVTHAQNSGISEAGTAPLLELFRTNEGLPDEKRIREALICNGKNYLAGDKMDIPPYTPDSAVWEVDYERSEKAGFLDRLLNWSREDKLSGRDTALGKQDLAEDTQAQQQDTEQDKKPTKRRKKRNH